MNRFLISIVFILAGPALFAQAQPGDFCGTLNTVISSAAKNSFRDIKDSVIAADAYAISWRCKAILPGSIHTRLLSAMGLRYEAAMFQSGSKDAMKEYFDKCKTQLSNCLADYKLSQVDNFVDGLSDFKKVLFIRNITQDTAEAAPPPHVSLEVNYFKSTGTYSIVLNVWEH